MTTLAIVTDADASLPAALRTALGIRTAPLEAPLLVDQETIPRLRSEAGPVPTAEALAACNAAIEGGASAILYLAAGDGYGTPPDLESTLATLEVDVTIEQTEGALMGAGWQAIAAAEAIRDGGGLPEALAAARRVRAAVNVLVMLEHPEMASAAGNAELGIVRHRALVYLRGPEVSIISRPTRREAALALLRDRFAESVTAPARAHVAVQHASAGPGADALARWIERELAPARLVVAPITRHAATRLGPRVLAVAWYEDPIEGQPD